MKISIGEYRLDVLIQMIREIDNGSDKNTKTMNIYVKL